MIYLKTYEDLYPKENVINMKGYVYINRPDDPTKFVNIVFPIKVVYVKEIGGYDFNRYGYEIFGNQIKIIKDKRYTYDGWDQFYYKEDYNRINFIPLSTFYEQYEEFIREHMLNIQERLESKEILTHGYMRVLEELLDCMTIPETEHILQIKKYNL